MAKPTKIQNLATGLAIFAKYHAQIRYLLFVDDMDAEEALTKEEEIVLEKAGWRYDPDLGWCCKL